ncbi:MAG: hypothetical protein ABW061_15525 [Polyangiaceae bacterium]
MSARALFSPAHRETNPDHIVGLELERCEYGFVDDKPQNVKSASSVGIHSICFANSKDGRAQFALRELLAEFGIAIEA